MSTIVQEIIRQVFRKHNGRICPDDAIFASEVQKIFNNMQLAPEEVESFFIYFSNILKDASVLAREI